MHWIIAAIIAPVPLFHLWLHALLPFWRKRPLLIYVVALAAWIATTVYFSQLNLRSEYMFAADPAWRVFSGYALMLIGAAAILSSIFTLGAKRFFVWAVLKPDSTPKIRIGKGVFHSIPHPAYIGYLCVALGNFLVRGQFYLLYLFIVFIILIPIVIRFEEEELRQRVAKDSY